MDEGGSDHKDPGWSAQPPTVAGDGQDPSLYAILRLTNQAGSPLKSLYRVPGHQDFLNDMEFLAWLERSIPDKTVLDHQALALLVIRETTDEAGFVRECSIERRRGSVDGPFYGDPARIEIAWPAAKVRIYRIACDGVLVETETRTENQLYRERTSEQFSGELQAVYDHFTTHVAVHGCRLPTAIEAAVGLDTILRVRLPDGGMADCGVGWHRTVPFVIQAAFPCFGSQLTMTAEQAVAVRDFITGHNLVRLETRSDGSVVVRRRSRDELFVLRVQAGMITAEPYQHTPQALALADQARWMRYVETYEGLRALDAWKDAEAGGIFVITTDGDGVAWRHHVDWDGVETWRILDEQLTLALGADLPHDGIQTGESRIRPGPHIAGAAHPSFAAARIGRLVDISRAEVVTGRSIAFGRGLSLGKAEDNVSTSANGRAGVSSVESPLVERQ